MKERLPAKLEVDAILRRCAAAGGFAAVLKRGDADRGTLILLVTSRGTHRACLERVLGLDGAYAWRTTGPSESADPEKVAHFLAQRARFDDDLWAIELDIADPERFIAETTSEG